MVDPPPAVKTTWQRIFSAYSTLQEGISAILDGVRNGHTNLALRDTSRDPAGTGVTSPPSPPPGRDDFDADDIAATLCDRVKQLRAARGWTLDRLAAVSGVSRSMLSNIERGAASPTVAVACRIARAFRVSLSDLLDESGRMPTIDVVRQADRAYHYRTSKECRIRSLTPAHLQRDVEFFEVEIKAGAALRSVPHFAGTREFLSVREGSVRVRAGDEVTELAVGDCAHYPADVQHAIENTGKSTAVLFLVEIYRRQGS
jgi:transcriptional regulator with XRE-family HTH domain